VVVRSAYKLPEVASLECVYILRPADERMTKLEIGRLKYRHSCINVSGTLLGALRQALSATVGSNVVTPLCLEPTRSG
jgi:hypothetical protein